MSEYYNILFISLKNANYLYDRKMNINWRKDFQYYYDMFNWQQELIENLKDEYNFDAKNILLVNSKKLYLIADFFGSNINIHNLKGGIYFLLLGCLLDYLIDEGTSEQKEKAKRKLEWGYCCEYFETGIIAKENDSIDYLYQLIGEYLQIIKEQDFCKYQYIIKLLKQAIFSER